MAGSGLLVLLDDIATVLDDITVMSKVAAKKNSRCTGKESSFVTQVFVVSAVALKMTVGVYGLVAGIIKLDDAGFS